jgi:hypothetical protein
MEAAPNTWTGSTEDPALTWCSNTTSFVPALNIGPTFWLNNGNAIGAGYANTQRMLRLCTWGAANAAVGYNGGGKSDWHLPARDELEQLYAQRDRFSCPSFCFFPHFYSSSSENEDAAYAEGVLFLNGQAGRNTKTNPVRVRPVRAF